MRLVRFPVRLLEDFLRKYLSWNGLFLTVLSFPRRSPTASASSTAVVNSPFTKRVGKFFNKSFVSPSFRLRHNCLKFSCAELSSVRAKRYRSEPLRLRERKLPAWRYLFRYRRQQLMGESWHGVQQVSGKESLSLLARYARQLQNLQQR